MVAVLGSCSQGYTGKGCLGPALSHSLASDAVGKYV